MLVWKASAILVPGDGRFWGSCGDTGEVNHTVEFLEGVLWTSLDLRGLVLDDSCSGKMGWGNGIESDL